MANARLIHKTIHTNPDLGDLEIRIRYFYKALIIHADDEGRLRANPKHLKALIFPFDEGLRNDTLSEWLEKLHASGLICLYAVGGKDYLYHPNWKNWQTIRADRFKPSDCPCQPNDNQMTTKRQPSAAEPNLTQPNLTNKNQPEKPPAQFSEEFVKKADEAKKKGFNIYQLSGKFYKESKLSEKLPESVLLAVLEEFNLRGSGVEEIWPYFLRVLGNKSALYFAEKNIKEGEAYKDKTAFSIADIIAGLK